MAGAVSTAVRSTGWSMANLARWNEIFAELGLPADPEVHAELRCRYSGPGRAYHNLHHVCECLDLFERVRAHCLHPQEVELALWFHDAVCDARRSDNELRSAEWAVAVLRRVGADPGTVERVYGLILATAPQVDPVTEDECLIADIDLAILGARPRRYEAYERELRQEHHHVPQTLYTTMRKKILRDYLQRPQLYHTEWFRSRYETPARGNLQRMLRRLTGGGVSAIGIE